MAEVIISNSKLNSQGFRVLTQGIDITQYQRNPILLWQHNRPFRGTTDEVLPIGRIENLRIDGDNLIGTPVFDEKDEFANKIKLKFEAGFLKMVSAGLNPVEVSDDVALMVPGQRRATLTKSKLTEVSIVDIGANDDALVLYKDGKMITLASGGIGDIIPEITIKNNLNDNKMKAIALKLGLTEAATEADILANISTLQTEAATAVTLRQQVTEQQQAAIAGAVDAAIALKKITADQKEHFVKLGKSVGLDVLNDTLKFMTPAVKPTDVIIPGAGSAQPGSYKKLSELPADAAIVLRQENKEEYIRLYKAEYGIEPEF